MSFFLLSRKFSHRIRFPWVKLKNIGRVFPCYVEVRRRFWMDEGLDIRICYKST